MKNSAVLTDVLGVGRRCGYFPLSLGRPGYWCSCKLENITGRGVCTVSDVGATKIGIGLPDQLSVVWAGTQLICIGDYLNPDDLPATIQQDNLHLISAESDSYEEEEAATLTAMEESVNRKNRVLRNLTTSQYVLEDKLRCGVTIGHIVLMRICWSSESSTGIPGGEYLAKGDWAGHEFDIVDADMLENMNGEWENVTEDTRDEVQVLWSSDSGHNWETEWRY
ncbi:hypothetical protein N7467_001247 [Penicillium canescens]|nr:hypothetical protein N7467_001247 [Penicillium canescens]